MELSKYTNIVNKQSIMRVILFGANTVIKRTEHASKNKAAF